MSSSSFSWKNFYLLCLHNIFSSLKHVSNPIHDIIINKLNATVKPLMFLRLKPLKLANNIACKSWKISARVYMAKEFTFMCSNKIVFYLSKRQVKLVKIYRESKTIHRCHKWWQKMTKDDKRSVYDCWWMNPLSTIYTAVLILTSSHWTL